MTSYTSTLGSRGWALLVLAGGFVLAIPFFKGGSPAKPQYSSSKDSSTSNRAASQQALPVGLGVDSPPLQSVKTAVGSPNNLGSSPPSLSTLEADRIVPLQGMIEQPKSGLIAVTSVNDSAQLVQPTRSPGEPSLAGAVPMQTELPSWAKKSSLLDTLITSKSATASQAEAGELSLPEARKPSPYRAWTPQEPTNIVINHATQSTDRYSPFGNSDETPLTKQTPSLAPTEWPDEDPRTAVAPPKIERLVGRDAMIRDPKVLETFPEQIGRTVVHPGSMHSSGAVHAGAANAGASNGNQPSFNQSVRNIVVQPKFGQSQAKIMSGTKSQVGPALQSKLPPDEQQYIRQPRM